MGNNGEQPIEGREALAKDSLLVVLIGASAVGKSTLARDLCDAGLMEATPTWTTRRPRDGEVDTSYDHRFVTEAVYEQHSRKGGFVSEHAIYGARYGLPWPRQPAEGRDALMVLKPVFIPPLVKHFPMARIYQIEASRTLVPERMKNRGQSEADIAGRMLTYDAETAEARRYAHAIFDNSGPLTQTYHRLLAQIRLDKHLLDTPLL